MLGGQGRDRFNPAVKTLGGKLGGLDAEVIVVAGRPLSADERINGAWRNTRPSSELQPAPSTRRRNSPNNARP
jgi:hypothetical protein